MPGRFWLFTEAYSSKSLSPAPPFFLLFSFYSDRRSPIPIASSGAVAEK